MGENAILKKRRQEQARKEQENNMKVIIIILNQKIYFWSCLRKNWNLGTHWRSNQKVTKCIKVGASKFFPLILESRTKSSLCKNRFLSFLPCPYFFEDRPVWPNSNYTEEPNGTDKERGAQQIGPRTRGRWRKEDFRWQKRCLQVFWLVNGYCSQGYYSWF